MLTITSHHPRPLSPAFFHSWQPNNVSWGTPAHVDTLEGMSTCQTPLMIAYCCRWLARIGEVKRRLPAARPRTHWAPVPSGGRSVPSEAAFRLSKAEQPWPWRPLAITNNLQATREQQMGFSRNCCPHWNGSRGTGSLIGLFSGDTSVPGLYPCVCSGQSCVNICGWLQLKGTTPVQTLAIFSRATMQNLRSIMSRLPETILFGC